MLHWSRIRDLFPVLGKGQEKTDEGQSETGEQPEEEKQSGNESQDQRKEQHTQRSREGREIQINELEAERIVEGAWHHLASGSNSRVQQPCIFDCYAV